MDYSIIYYKYIVSGTIQEFNSNFQSFEVPKFPGSNISNSICPKCVERRLSEKQKQHIQMFS